MIEKQHLIDRFVSYVTVDTESDPTSENTPSTKKQWDLANALVAELKEIGMEDVSIDENSYIMATLPSNLDKELPIIGFMTSGYPTFSKFSNAASAEKEKYVFGVGMLFFFNNIDVIILFPQVFATSNLLITGMSMNSKHAVKCNPR
jgi:hypothetical protein